MKSSELEKGKKLGRGLEEISSLFLSSAEPDRSTETDAHPASSPSSFPWMFPLFCCLSASPAGESFFACNLSVEIAKNDRTVTLVDLGFERSAVLYLMGRPPAAPDGLPSGDSFLPHCKVQSIRFSGLPEITLVSPAAPGRRGLSKGTAERIFAQEKVRKSNVILINSPAGPDGMAMPEIFTRFPRAVFFVDEQAHSVVKAYSWIKRLSASCRRYVIGAVFREGENSDPAWRNVARLQETIFKHLPLDLELRVVAMPLDRESRVSIESRKPLALMESPASSCAEAIVKLCKNLLGNE